MDGARAVGAAPSGGGPRTERSHPRLRTAAPVNAHCETNGDIGGGSGEKTPEGADATGRLRILSNKTVPPRPRPRETAKTTTVPSALLSVAA